MTGVVVDAVRTPLYVARAGHAVAEEWAVVDRLSGGRPCQLHQTLALPPDQMRAVEVGDPAWSLVRLRLIERGLGAIQSTEAGVDVTRDGMGLRLRATQPGPKGRRAGGYCKVAGLPQEGEGCTVVTAEQRDVGRLGDGERL